MQMLPQGLTQLILTYLDTEVLLSLPRDVLIVRQEIMRRCPMDIILCLYPHIIEKWDNISYDRWTLEFMQKHQLIEKHKLNQDVWYYLAENDLDINIMRTYADIANWIPITKDFAWTITTIVEFEDRIQWPYLSTNRYLTPDIIDRYQDRLDWWSLSIYFRFNLDLVKRYQDRIVWSQLSNNKHLTYEIIDSYADRLDWSAVSRCFAKPGWLLDKYPERIGWQSFSRNTKLQVVDIERCQDKIHWKEVAECVKNREVIMRWCDNGVHPKHYNWNYISGFVELTPKFVEKFCGYFNWPTLSENDTLTHDMIQTYQYSWDWVNLSYNQCLTLDTLEEFSDKLRFQALSSNTCLVTAFKRDKQRLFNFIAKYQERWDWLDLSLLFLEYAVSDGTLEIILDHPEWPWTFQ